MEYADGPFFLDGGDLAVHFFEGLLQRLDEIIDGFLPGGQIGLRALLEFFESDVGQFQKRLVVALQRVGGKRFESVAQFLLGAVEQRQLLFRGFPLFLKGRVQFGLRFLELQ